MRMHTATCLARIMAPRSAPPPTTGHCLRRRRLHHSGACFRCHGQGRCQLDLYCTLPTRRQWTDEKGTPPARASIENQFRAARTRAGPTNQAGTGQRKVKRSLMNIRTQMPVNCGTIGPQPESRW